MKESSNTSSHEAWNKGKLVGQTLDGKPVPITLVIEEQTSWGDQDLQGAPRIPDAGRQIGEDEDLIAPPIPDAEVEDSLVE